MSLMDAMAASLEPAHSGRACDGEFDGDDSQNRVFTDAPIFKSCPGAFADGKETCDVLVIGLLGSGCCLAESLWPVDACEQIGLLLIPETPLRGNPFKSTLRDGSCPIYRSKSTPGVVIVSVRQSVAAERAFAWTSSLFQHLVAERVVVLDELSLVNYHTADPADLQFPLVRVVESTVASEANVTGCLSLEPPNLVTGIAAAVVSHRMHRQQHATVLVTVFDHAGRFPQQVLALKAPLAAFGVKGDRDADAAVVASALEDLTGIAVDAAADDDLYA